MRLNYWLSIIYMLLFATCDVSIPLPETELEQVIVANAFFSPDSTWQVQLTKSFALNQADQVELVANGIVEIQDLANNQTIKLIHQQNGMYTSQELLPNDSLYSEKAGHFSLDANSDNELVEIDHTGLKQSYLTDLNFNGKTYSTQVGASSLRLNDLAAIDHLTAMITIKSISSEGYQHAKTVETFEFGDSFSSPEPVNIFSNIENGFGVFAGFVSQRIEVKLK